MYWYFIYDRFGITSQLLNYFNRQEGISAFVPKMEKWFGNSKVKEFQVKDLMPGYILIQSGLNEKEFIRKYKDFLVTLDCKVQLIQSGDVLTLTPLEQNLYQHLFDQDKVIRHSTGNIVNSKLIVEKGPLKGLESFVGKIDRHKRQAILEIEDKKIIVPLAVITKS